jgi:ribosomal protein L16 Arg81 hydroxylase
MGYLTDCSRINSKVNTICSQLDVFTNAPADAHMFFSLVDQNEEQGFGIHSDVSHNLIVQVEGSTRIEVWDVIDEDGIGNVKNIPTDPIIDVTLNSGDVVFIPKRHWHKATSKTKRLSISFPCQPDLDVSKTQQRYWINVGRLVN